MRMISRTLLSSCCALVVLLSISPEARSQDPLGHYCQNTTYNPNGTSTYRANLNFLLSSLSNAARTSDFSNSTAGLNTSNPTYGHFMCRGDVNRDSCESCVANATGKILERCSDQKIAVIWYDYCLLRYSNRSIFSVPDRNIILSMYNTQNVTTTQLARFNDVLGNMMDEIATQAASGGSGKKFAVQEGNFSSFAKLFTLAQCTPDLSKDDCDTCLRDAISRIPSCCDGRQGGRVLVPSCNIRYETYKFYNSTIANAPPPAPLPNVTPPPASTTPTTSNSKGKRISVAVVIAIIAPIVVSIVLFVLGFLFLKRRSKKRYDAIADATDGNDMSTAESLHYNLSQVQAATNNFSVDNKIGEGGFGDVYKGTLPNGQEIAVKRLSRTSLQGAEEFKNEMVLVAKLQHRNLVRLLGFSLEGEEKILIYEFVPNKSLDYFLFDPEKQPMLDWSRRQKIIEGIARGLLYLHEDSRLRIIHRDLKASNILLDANMNPKIADFGMARIFGVDQSEGKTSRIAGTYGYMPPEYAMHGQFSVKSDVYSFGILVLEIISGRKNSSFYQSDQAEDLPSYAWKNWRDGTPLALLDPALGDSHSRNEVIRCIHVGLLCVQDDVEQRPAMASVVLMLNSYSVTQPAPQQPAFFARSKTESWRIMEPESDKSTSKSVPASVNETSITELYPR